MEKVTRKTRMTLPKDFVWHLYRVVCMIIRRWIPFFYLHRVYLVEYRQRKDFATKIPVYSCQRKTLDKPCANEKLYQLFLLLEQRRKLEIEHKIHALA